MWDERRQLSSIARSAREENREQTRTNQPTKEYYEKQRLSL